MDSARLLMFRNFNSLVGWWVGLLLPKGLRNICDLLKEVNREHHSEVPPL